MPKIKIFQVIECGGPGGCGNQAAALCNGLDPSRFETTLVYAVRPGGTSQEFESMARGAAHFIYLPEMTREIAPLRDAKAWLQLYHLFRQHHPDIVHGHSSKAGFLSRTAAWAAGVPKIFYSPRGYSFLQEDRSTLSLALYRFLERMISWIGETVAISESEADLARHVVRARSVQIIRDAYLGKIPAPHPSLSPLGGEGESKQMPILICASGRLSYARHPEAFLRLTQQLTRSRRNVRCLWIGGGELEPSIRKMVKDMNLNSKLEITGWLGRDEALKRMQSADIFVHFSRWDGLPNSVIEAMALGLPVVASDIPGNRNLIRHGETGLLAKTEIELLNRTLELIAQPELRASLGQKARAMILNEYSEERMLHEYEHLYSI